MATHGLKPAEEKILARRLRQLEAAEPRLCVVGGGDARDIAALKKRLKDRLEPEQPDDIEADCAALMKNHWGTSWFELAMSVD
jgi:hypothetical protein